MDYNLIVIITIFVIGFVGSFISGMVGVGGAIINYPLLLFIPPLLGIASFSAYEVSGITAVQVFFATIGGVYAYRNSGYLNKTLIGYMGVSVLIGSFSGGYLSSRISEGGINLIYGILAILAVIMMFIPKKGGNQVTNQPIIFNKWLSVILALFVGIGAGIVGAGGAFLLVPIMLVVLNIPMKTTIATSLAITFVSSIGTLFSKLLTGQVLFIPAIIMVVASLLAAPLGAKIGIKMNTKVLQTILALLILGTAFKIWFDLIVV